MFKNYGLLFGIIALVFISLYLLMYILRNIYCNIENKTLRVLINKLLPILSKYNSLFLILGFINTLLHILYIFTSASILNTGYVSLFILLLIIKFTFFTSSKYDQSYILNTFAYLLLFSLIIHCFV